MKKDSKKILIIGGLVLDLILVVFLFVLSILVLCIPEGTLDQLKGGVQTPSNFIEWFGTQPIAFALIVVLPLFLLLFGNIAILFLYVKKANKKKKVAVNDLSAEEKEKLRKELLNDLNDENKDK